MKTAEKILNIDEKLILEPKPKKKGKRYWHKLDRREIRKELLDLIRFTKLVRDIVD